MGQCLRDESNAIVPGLLSAGEAGCASVHGANRLGANSLLDLVVFGREAAKTAAEKILANRSQKFTLNKDDGSKSIDRVETILNKKGDIKTSDLREDMQRNMQRH